VSARYPTTAAMDHLFETPTDRGTESANTLVGGPFDGLVVPVGDLLGFIIIESQSYYTRWKDERVEHIYTRRSSLTGSDGYHTMDYKGTI